MSDPPMPEYQGNFIEPTRAILAAARQHAIHSGAACGTTGDILIAALRDKSGLVGRVLASTGIHLAEAEVTTEIGNENCSATAISGSGFPWSAEARAALVLAMDAARELGHNYVGPAHLVLGIVREEAGTAGRSLRKRGLTPRSAADAVGRLVPARRDELV